MPILFPYPGLNSFGYFVILLEWAILILTISAVIFATKKFVDIAREKGYENTGSIWFIGLFATPIVAGLLTLQLPDMNKSVIERVSSNQQTTDQPQQVNEAERTLEQRLKNAQAQYDKTDDSILAKHRYNEQLQYVDKRPKQ